VVDVQIGLSGGGIARVDVADELPLVDVGYLLRQEGGAAHLVIHAGRTEQDDRYLAVTVLQQLFGVYLRLRIGRFRRDRPLLIDRRARIGRCVDQHRAGENELFRTVRPKHFQQAPRPLDRYLLIFRVRVTAEVVVAGEMNDGGDATTFGHGRLDCSLGGLVGSQVDLDG